MKTSVPLSSKMRLSRMVRICLEVSNLNCRTLRRKWGLAPLCGAEMTFSHFSEAPSRLRRSCTLEGLHHAIPGFLRTLSSI